MPQHLSIKILFQPFLSFDTEGSFFGGQWVVLVKSDSGDSYEMDEELGKCFKMTMVPFYVFTRGKLVGWFFKKFSFNLFLKTFTKYFP